MLYVVYVVIEGARATDWVKWMVHTHIPAVLATGCFVSASLVRDSEADGSGRVGYRCYYRAATDADVDRYQAEHARRLQAEHSERYAGAFSARREVLPLVTHF
ncbi:MAG: DUF4286 family protein [Myxococcales bacterium]|nr:DUF4286 family protein [Myxococcales bacterium]